MSSPPLNPTYIPEEHFKNFLENQLIKLNREQMKEARNMFDILYSYFNSHYQKKRDQFFSHAIIYNWLVGYLKWNDAPLGCISQNLQNKNSDFQDFIDSFLNTFTQM